MVLAIGNIVIALIGIGALGLWFFLMLLVKRKLDQELAKLGIAPQG